MTLPTRAAPRLPFEVAAVCFGTSPLGSMPDTYGYEVPEAQARAAIHAMFDLRPSFVDTSRNYGMGRSEERLGAVIRERGGLPEGCVLATKLDRDWQDNRLDADRARRSVEESLQALGLDRLDILHLHDPEYCRDLDEITGPGGALDELFKMKQEGLVSAVGLAMGKLDLMTRILPDWEFDALVSHNRFTLLNREADRMFSDAHARGIAIFNAAPYAGGVLARGSANSRMITYQEASEADMAPVRAIEQVCARHDVAPGAAALQFSMRDPRVTSTICGISKPERVAQTVDWASAEIPQAAWDELMALPYSTEDPEANREYRPC
ncbi:aldo/keto reductase [Rhodobacteraceae bacterium 2CG4]|uniref:Aldo/keto reductase n=1 Tax=Halovulum marinum TaxID=2662447 RepID=A0A6L5Z402_9RHOB|nr:aldo/keto reductase [Halovulum marinum]MSU91278.1 aldo/keto reductase [Halovulum marinum]